jgi:hypothetical protein
VYEIRVGFQLRNLCLRRGGGVADRTPTKAFRA